MLLQAYDFVYLNEHFGCQLQVGGSDQWGNITAGIDLGRRMRAARLDGVSGDASVIEPLRRQLRDESLFGITVPLLTKSDGSKMGKTESGAVWLSAERTSPYQFYQYWINVDDADAGKCLRFLTELAREEIEALDQSRATEPQQRSSQKRLAESLTELVHGPAGLAAARRATEIFFGAEIVELSDRQLGEIFADVPSQKLARARLEGPGLNIIDALCEAKLAQSKSEARRTVEQGGAYVNNRRIEGIATQLGPQHLASESVLVLRSGRKKYALLRFE